MLSEHGTKYYHLCSNGAKSSDAGEFLDGLRTAVVLSDEVSNSFKKDFLNIMFEKDDSNIIESITRFDSQLDMGNALLDPQHNPMAQNSLAFSCVFQTLKALHETLIAFQANHNILLPDAMIQAAHSQRDLSRRFMRGIGRFGVLNELML